MPHICSTQIALRWSSNAHAMHRLSQSTPTNQCPWHLPVSSQSLRTLKCRFLILSIKMPNSNITLHPILMFQDVEYLDILSCFNQENPMIWDQIQYNLPCVLGKLFQYLSLTKKRNTGNIKCNLNTKYKTNEHYNSLSRDI